MTSWSWWAWLLAGIGWVNWLLVFWQLGRLFLGHGRVAARLVRAEGCLCGHCSYLHLKLVFETRPAMSIDCVVSGSMAEKLTSLLARGGGKAEDP